jgi:hypothetical protein
MTSHTKKVITYATYNTILSQVVMNGTDPVIDRAMAWLVLGVKRMVSRS